MVRFCDKMQPEFPLRFSQTQLAQCADSFPAGRVTFLVRNLASAQGKFKLLRVASKAFIFVSFIRFLSHLSFLPSYTLIHNRTPPVVFNFTLGVLQKQTVVQIKTPKDLGWDGPRNLYVFNLPM